jgi:hypothetical protein
MIHYSGIAFGSTPKKKADFNEIRYASDHLDHIDNLNCI